MVVRIYKSLASAGQVMFHRGQNAYRRLFQLIHHQDITLDYCGNLLFLFDFIKISCTPISPYLAHAAFK